MSSLPSSLRTLYDLQSSPKLVLAPSAHGISGGPEAPWLKTLIGGGITLLLELSGGHTIEMLKIKKQTSPQFSYLQLTKQMTAQKGIVGLLDGFLPWGVLQALAKGAVFGWGHAVTMKALHNTDALSKDTKTIVSGGMGGLVQGVFMSPLLLLKTRVMTNPTFRTSGGVWETAVASGKLGFLLIKEEGVMALCKGMGVFAAKRMADWTTRYYFVVQVEALLRTLSGPKLSVSEQLFSSFAGGALSALATIPLDVLVATFQQASKAGQKVSVADTVKELAKGGAGKVFEFSTRGLLARVTHVGITTVMMKTVTSLVYDLFK